MYKQGGAGLDRKRISDALDKHLEKAVASPSTSRGSAGGGGGRDHHRLVVSSWHAASPAAVWCAHEAVADALLFGGSK